MEAMWVVPAFAGYMPLYPSRAGRHSSTDSYQHPHSTSHDPASGWYPILQLSLLLPIHRLHLCQEHKCGTSGLPLAPKHT